ncbi:MAG: GNAT family N-acetyltransferase [Candidatus Zixiibacteriota bacterium]
MKTDLIRELGPLAFASRLRRLSDQLSHDVSMIYRDFEADFEARWFPVARLLGRQSPIGVTEIAESLGYTHPAVSQIAAAMEKRGLIRSRRDRTDERRRLLSLTAKGKSTLAQIAPVWEAVRECTGELIRESGQDFLQGLAAMEESLRRRPMAERLQTRLDSGSEVEIVPFTRTLERHFESLNREWLGPILPLEDNDRRILRNPSAGIIQRGGQILFARIGESVVGTVAIILQRPGIFEIAKMAVTTRRRGKGIGRRLAQAAIDWARQSGAADIRIATSPKLKAALALYQSMGFTRTTPDPAWRAEYQRRTIFMTLAPPRIQSDSTEG